MGKRRLKDMRITHISLVKAAANGREFLYKSAEAEPSYDRVIDIAKQDEEKGLIYGLVYEPDKVDAQNEFADAASIEKAAHGFMKELNARNVDANHSFKNEDAYVAESWLVKKGDPIFPDAKEGSWAVAIKIESDKLKESVKKGDFKGLSMAGTALKEEVSDNDKSLADTIKSAFESVLKTLTKSDGKTLDKSAVEAVVKQQIEPIVKERDELKAKLAKAEADVASITKERDEVKAELTKSKQDANVPTDPTADVIKNAKDLAHKAQEAIAKSAEAGVVLNIADAIDNITKGAK